MRDFQIKKEQVKLLLDKRFIRVFDLQYKEDRHYYVASRRAEDDLVAVKTEEEFRRMLPDAVSCVVVLELLDNPPLLLLSQEYRYAAGRFLLSVPAGLIDPEDAARAQQTGDTAEAILAAARREIKEETGLILAETDRISIVNPFLFSTPGMTDESNALVCAVAKRENADFLTQEGAEGSELFDGFCLVTLQDAKRLLREGCDGNGHYYSIFTWAALTYFCSLYEE